MSDLLYLAMFILIVVAGAGFVFLCIVARHATPGADGKDQSREAGADAAPVSRRLSSHP